MTHPSSATLVCSSTQPPKGLTVMDSQGRIQALERQVELLLHRNLQLQLLLEEAGFRDLDIPRTTPPTTVSASTAPVQTTVTLPGHGSSTLAPR